jgi:hypothetical protein
MTDVINISAEERSAITQPAADAVKVAEGFKIVTDEGYTAAADRLKIVKGLAKDLAAKKAAVLNPALEVVKQLRALFAEPEAALERAEKLYKGAVLSYQQEQERIRQEKQRILDEAARKEREKAEREAAQARERAEEQRRRAEEAQRAGDAKEAERLAALATLNEQKSEAKTDLAQSVVPGVVQQEAPKVAGISTRETWSALVLDPKDLVINVAVEILRQREVKADTPFSALSALYPSQCPLAAVEPSMTFLNKQAKALKKELRYSGVKAVVEKGIAAGSK